MYKIQDKEAGNEIAVFEKESETIEELTKYEEEDRSEGIYVPNFYEIREIVDPDIIDELLIKLEKGVLHKTDCKKVKDILVKYKNYKLRRN